MTKNTQGPWFTSGGTVYSAATVDNVSVCILPTDRPAADLDQIEANARLIAAAPDMLAALENLVRPLGPGWTASDVSKLIGAGKAAIAKAKGVQP